MYLFPISRERIHTPYWRRNWTGLEDNLILILRYDPRRTSHHKFNSESESHSNWLSTMTLWRGCNKLVTLGSNSWILNTMLQLLLREGDNLPIVASSRSPDADCCHQSRSWARSRRISHNWRRRNGGLGQLTATPGRPMQVQFYQQSQV